MRQRAVTALGIGLMVMVVSGGCSDRHAETINIDGHSFEVPRKHLIEERIHWLPQSEEKGLMFYIYPDAPVRERIIVLVESRDVTCRYADTASEQLARQCAKDSNQPNAKSFEGENAIKTYQDGDLTQWSYVAENANGTPATIASCVGRADDEGGRCTVLGSYSDLVYVLRVRDSEVDRLPEIKRSISQLLSAWERGKNSGEEFWGHNTN